jgi:DNA-binding NarL/FixJ family response regulator
LTDLARDAGADSKRRPARPASAVDARGGKLALVDGIPRPGGSAAADRDAVRVLVADGHALVRAGLRALLETDRGIGVVGEAATGDEAVALARRTGPEVAVIDAWLPGLDSVEATARISADSGGAVLVLLAHEEDEVLLAAVRAGASGALVKDTAPAALVGGVKAVARGQALLSPPMTRRLIAELASIPEPASPSPGLVDELTARQREVVRLVALGLSNDDIAERLVVSRTTAKTHVSRAMLKLHARTRAELVVFGYETGLVVPKTTSRRAPIPQDSAAARRQARGRDEPSDQRAAD